MNQPDTQQARAWYLQDATQVLVPGLLDSTAVGYVKQTPGSLYDAQYVIFYADQPKPAKFFSAWTLAEAVAIVTRELQRMLAAQGGPVEQPFSYCQAA